MKTSLLFTPLLLLSVFLQAQLPTNHWETAVYENDTWRYRVPTVEPDTNWRKITFNASTWSQGPGGFGFADGDDNTVTNQNTSVYFRITFNVPDTSKISEAVLNVDYDDGFVAYLNNIEMARANISVNGRPAFNDFAAGSHEAQMYQGGNPDYFSIPKSFLINKLVPGTNVLAIQVHNVTANSSDLTGRVWLSFGITDNSTFFGPTPNWFVAPVSFTSSNLPIVVINTNNQTILDEPKTMADMGIIYNGIGNRNYMTDTFNNYNGKIGIEYRGSSSQGFPKKPYGIELWDVNGFAIDSPLVDMPKESDWILFASYTDKSLLNNFLTYHLANEIGWYAARCRHVEVVLNGQYQGVYVLMEKIKRNNDRVDIAKLLPQDIYGDELTGGYIIKIDKSTGNGGGGWVSNFAPDTAVNGQTIFFQYDYPCDTCIMPQQEAYIQAYIDSFETALAGPNFADTAIGYNKYIKTNSFIDYLLLNEISRNVDGYRLSTYLHKDKYSNDGRLVIGPVWDYDIAWANANYCRGRDTTGWAFDFAAACPGDYWQIPFWWDRLMEDTAFQNKLRCRWEELKMTALSVNYLHSYIDSMANYLNESQQRNFVKWPILGQYVWPNPSPIPTTYQGEIDELKNWITARWAWLDANIPGVANCNLTDVPASPAASPSSVGPYPNPFTNEVNFSLYLVKQQNVTVNLYDMTGKAVMPQTMFTGVTGNNTFRLATTEQLASGIYLLHISDGVHTWTQQLVKE
ncbi:MAG: hypothetical protein Fur0041_02450 [Bacteroidia bacterium]